MVNAVEAARQAARRALESAYEGVCSVTEYRETTDERTGLSGQEEAAVHEGVPCRLSFEKQAAAGQTDTAASLAQGVKLFLAPEIMVKPGSRVTVTQNGVTTEYAASGQPAVYSTHQEILLELFRGWS